MVDHGDGAVTLHAHLAAEYVTVGQRLDQGQLIGRVGTSGGSTGPHLHYEQREGSGVARPVFGDTAFAMPTTQASANCPHTPVAGDWNDDGVDDLGGLPPQRGPELPAPWGPGGAPRRRVRRPAGR